MILPPLPVGDICLNPQKAIFDFPDSFVHGNGDNVKGEHDVCANIADFLNHVVLDIVGVIFEIHNTPVPFADFEVIFFVFKRVGADIVLKIMPFFCHIHCVKEKGCFFVRAKKAM